MRCLNSDSRLKLIKTSLEKAVDLQLEHVIFDCKQIRDRVRYVQFSLDYEENVAVLDVPFIELSKIELIRAERVIKKNASDITEKNNGSFQKAFAIDNMDEASQMVEKIFRSVFLFPSDYSITVEYV